MITNADIAKLAKVLATKQDVFEIRERLDRIEVTVSSHTLTLDKLSKNVEDIMQENIAIKRHIGLI